MVAYWFRLIFAWSNRSGDLSTEWDNRGTSQPKGKTIPTSTLASGTGYRCYCGSTRHLRCSCYSRLLATGRTASTGNNSANHHRYQPGSQASGEYGFEKVSAKVLDESPKTEKTDNNSTVSSETPQTATRANTGGASASSAQYSLAALRRAGVVHWGGYKFTYYSQKVLPGGGLRIPGRHVNANGYVADADGYIVLANDAPKGTVINTPFGGPGKVYDRGTRGNHFDVYTS